MLKTGYCFTAVLVLALAVTTGTFASGFVNTSNTFNAKFVNADFITVTPAAADIPSWTVMGLLKGDTGRGALFVIDTAASGYTGGFTATVTLVNAGELIKIYRNLALTIEVCDAAGNPVDINADGCSDCRDFTLINLENVTAALYITQTAAGIYTVNLKNGYFNAGPARASWSSDTGKPVLFCEAAQR